MERLKGRPRGRPAKFGEKTCGRCGKPRDIEQVYGKYQSRRCRACHAADMREFRRHVPMTPEQRRKDNARSYASQYLKRGIIKRQPCQSCGDPKAQMHHHDYSKPLEVEWLCRRCHLLHHAAERPVPAPPPRPPRERAEPKPKARKIRGELSPQQLQTIQDLLGQWRKPVISRISLP